MLRLLALLLLASSLLPAGEPTVDPAQQELHGTFAGQPFWMRLLPADKQFGNNRVLNLVYTPPAESEVAGAHLSDCPFLLLDPRLRLVAWNGRDTGTKAVPAAPSGYAITREVSVKDGDDTRIDLQQRTVAGERGWDLRAAPLLLALAWQRGTNATIRLVDLFGPRHSEALTLTWQDGTVTIAGTAYTATADDAGMLKALTAADGTVLLTVGGRP
jgi:hypothetical protein